MDRGMESRDRGFEPHQGCAISTTSNVDCFKGIRVLTLQADMQT